jgi:hypothetical protein
MVVLLVGCHRQDAAPMERTVNVKQLAEETDHLVFFNYVGSDADFHHFTAADDKQYRIPRADLDFPGEFPATGTMRFFITVKDGVLARPDRREMAKLSHDEFERPYKRP